MTNTETPRPMSDEPEAYSNARTEMLEGWEKSQPQAQSEVDEPKLQADIKDIIANYRWGENLHETTLSIINILRPYLTQRPVDLSVCTDAAYKADVHQYPINIPEEDAERIAKAVLDVAQIPYTEKGGR